VYSRKINDQTYRFGVSGLLYKSNVLMYDQQTESLWSQVMQRAVTGPLAGTKLELRPSVLTTWGKWKSRHPGTDALTPATGHVRDYSKDPYEDYYASRSGLFGFLKGGPGAEDKELVVGVTIDDAVKAYRLRDIRSAGQVMDKLAGRQITLRFDNKIDKLTVEDGQGSTLDHIILYWFVWKGIYPASEVYRKQEP
jgi:hypothetical protein